MVPFLTSLCFCLLAGPFCFGAPPTEQIEQAMDLPGGVYFTPPEGWRMAEASQLPPNVKVMVVGKGDHTFAPSLNLTTESYKGSLKQYLKTVKSINDSRGAVWQDLGTIRTQAGNANLSQVDLKTEWGETRMMHVILVKNNNVYIMTAAALKDEFPRFYKEFFNALRSLHINKSVYEMVANPKKRGDLEKAVSNLKAEWLSYASESANRNLSKNEIFETPAFQANRWKPFMDKISLDYKEMSPKWREQLFAQTQNELLST